MKSFKSFDDFINESYTKSTGTKGTMPLNEALLSFLTPDQKFKVDEDKPDANAGEIAAFHFVMKMETENPDEAKKNAADQLSASAVVMSKVANNIVFIAVTKDKERSATGQQIFKGILSVRDASKYDVSKAQPFLTSSNGKLKLYKAEDATKMNSDLNPVVKPEIIKVETGTSGSSGTAGTTGTAGSAGSSGTGGTGGVFPWDWKDTAADDQILKYLTEKLLAFEIVSNKQDPNPNGRALQTGIKVSRGSKGQEVKFVQLILKEKVLAEKYGEAGKRVQDKLGDPDGNYGPNTATAFGMFFDAKEAEHNAVNSNDVEYLAKYCTKVGITLARLKELWELAGKGTNPVVTTGGTSGTGGTGGTGGTSGTAGQAGFIYINKPGGATAPVAVQTATAPAEGTEEKK